ncbi:MAG: metal ABC transporter permease [Gammaproteobacteria bacterium]
MLDFIDALTTHRFLQYALVAGLLASVGCGVIGTYVVVKRLGYLAGGIAHAVLAGMGVARFYDKPPILGAVMAAMIAALLIGWISLRAKQHEDTLISSVWAVGMAIGVLFIARTPGYNVDLMAYLFGNILFVSGEQLLVMVFLDLLILAAVALFYKQFLAVAFDEEFARARGIRTEFFYMLLLCLVALTVVLLIQVVGLILVIALLSLPPTIAAAYARSLTGIMFVASLLSAFFTTGGIMLSYQPDLPAGATIVVLAGGCFLVSTALSRLRIRRGGYRGAA